MNDVSLAAIACALTSAVLHASWNAMAKGHGDSMAGTAFIALFAALYAVPILFFVEAPPAAAWPFLLTSVAIHSLHYYAISQSYRFGRLHYTYALQRGAAPVFVAVLFTALGLTAYTTVQWLGLVVLLAGLLSLSVPALVRNLLWTSRDASTGDVERSNVLRATSFAIADGALVAFYLTSDSFGINASADTLGYVAWFHFVHALSVIPLFYLRRKRFLRTVPISRPQTGMLAPVISRVRLKFFAVNIRFGAVGGLMSIASYGLLLWAMTLGSVPIVTALRESSILFAALIGALVFHERIRYDVFIALALITGGVAVIKLGAP